MTVSVYYSTLVTIAPLQIFTLLQITFQILERN